jgi:asparagine synthetase B (glutamine-hydrolysing)
MNAGSTITFERNGPEHDLVGIEEHSFDGPPPSSLETASGQAKSALRMVMSQAPRNSVILLSGGVDSAAMAASAPTVPCLTWTTSRASRSTLSVDDTAAARRVADFLSLSHEIVLLNDDDLCKDVDAAVLLSETRRGTFIDDAVVYVQIARHLRKCGVGAAFIGEAADDVFGCLPYNLRYYQGGELLRKLRRSLMERAPADFSAMSRVFDHFGVTLIDPYLSAPIASLGFRLPLEMRVDAERLMKPVLRKAFADDLPAEITRRTKRVSRDVSGVRDIMADAFGVSRERFLPAFKSLFRDSGASERQKAVLDALDKT